MFKCDAVFDRMKGKNYEIDGCKSEQNFFLISCLLTGKGNLSCKKITAKMGGFFQFPISISTAFILLSLCWSLAGCHSNTVNEAPTLDFEQLPYPQLSQYGFFKGKMQRLQPAIGVLPYEMATPLFTDYAHKARFVWMPAGAQAQVDERGYIVFPEHTVLIKNFYYPADFRDADSEKDMVETRLLIQRNGRWEAFTYEWNSAGTEADLMQVGNIRPVAWTSESGEKMQIDYVIPNKNQCKSCHNMNDAVQPIGPKVRNLNFELTYPDGATANQLLRWQQEGYLAAGDYLPQHPAVPIWNEAQSGTLAQRAAAYLDANCGHCHRPEGPANTTGTFYHWEETELTRRGVGKAPVAAGKGSGGRHFGIVPGQPESSILVYRIESTDPGEMMPELGRVVPHREGIALLKEWIQSLN